MSDLINRQDAINAMMALQAEDDEAYGCHIPEGFDGERAKEALEHLPSAQPMQSNASNTLDAISRQAGINIVDSETVSTNPEHFKSSEKFIKFMDDADIASFGKWQWANGFNTALVATKVQLKKLPSAQPEKCEDCGNFDKARLLIPQPERKGRWIKLYPRAYKCSECKTWWEESEVDEIKNFTYCPKCGAKMEEKDEHTN